MADDRRSGGGTFNAPGSVGVDLSQPSLGDVSANSDSSGGTGTSEVQSFDISGLPFRFNPPLHKLSRFVLTNLGEGKRNAKNSLASFYDETGNQYGKDFAVRTDEKQTGFEKLRLGRIIMDDMAVSRGVIESGKRYGFRFLYNPSELGGTLNVGTDFIPNQQSTGTQVLQSGLENMQLEVLLNRIPDLNSNAKVSDYIPAISDNDRKRVQEEGTHYDLDFLYRCANGIHDTRWRKQTGDIGVLLPNPCRLILGPYTSRGAVVSVSVSDQMFSGALVPILSYVNITFARFLNMAPDEQSRLESYGISQDSSSSDSSSGGGTSGDTTDTSGHTLQGKDVWQNAKNAGFSPSEADTMTQIAKKESNWYTRAHNNKSPDNSYGLWQINMIGAMGPARRREYGISNNDELFNPVVNAKAARSVFKSQGFKAWSVYSNGSYKSVKVNWR